jgi:hypothetical protein
MQVITEVVDERCFRTGTRQEISVARERVEETKEPEAVGEVADETINRDHSLGLQFPSGI